MRASATVLALLTALAAPLSGTALAGPPPASCTPAGGNGCNLNSDIMVFGVAQGAYRIEGRIVQCTRCLPGAPTDPPGTLLVDGLVKIDFGPYDPALCSSTEQVVSVELSKDGPIRPGAADGGPGGNEPTYVPSYPNALYLGLPVAPLRTACVDARRLSYRIPKLFLTGDGGAFTFDPTQAPDDPKLDLPETVRGALAGQPVRTIPLNRFYFTQDLRLSFDDLYDPTSTLRIGPDALPFRIGPRQASFTEDRVRFTAPGPSGGGPTAYTPVPPDGSPATGLTPVQIRACSDPTGGFPCTVGSVANAGYLLSPSWKVNDGAFTVDGMDFELELATGQLVRYETLFPARALVELRGRALVSINDSRITSGRFDGGALQYQIGRDACGGGTDLRRHELAIGASRPQLGPDGSLLAAVVDLNANQLAGGDDPIEWTYNAASGLKCGTLHVPEAVADLLPQRDWLDSAVPTVLGRGLYAGVNFNRDRACRSSGGALLQKLCVVDADCDTSAGESCADAGFAPLCPAFDGEATWTATIEGHPRTTRFVPDAPSSSGREIAFVARYSGITGVFDGGETPFTMGDPAQNEFEFRIETLGTAFKSSRSQLGDTITRGSLVVPWPADTDVPFEEMRVCDCGRMDGGRTPQVLLERELGYWAQTYFPYGLAFSSQNNPDCTSPAGTACDATGQAASVCVSAVTPVPRFFPDPDAAFDLDPSGQAGQLTPYSAPQLEFDEDRGGPDGIAQAPYRFDLEWFAFADWSAAGSPSKAFVSAGLAPFGYVDARGELALPYFGLTPAGLKIERERNLFGGSKLYFADAHAPCDELTQPLCARNGDPAFVAAREIAAATVELPFRVDYFRPEWTLDPQDGEPTQSLGRGTFLAWADPATFDLGSARVAGGLVLRPGQIVGQDGDLGVAAALRAWSWLTPTGRTKLSSILPASRLGPQTARYDDALALLGWSESTWQLAPPALLRDALHDSGAIGVFAGVPAHPDLVTTFNVDGADPAKTPPVDGTNITGYVDFDAGATQVEKIELGSNMDTNGEFFQFDASLLTLDRHVQEGEEPIQLFSRRPVKGASDRMNLPGEQSIGFGGGGGGGALTDDGDDGPLTWHLDYDMTPAFTFRSLTGELDLTKGGLGSVGFDKMGATLKFFADGDWYFKAEMLGKWDGFRAQAGFLAGNTTDMTPLKELDPDVARFLSGVDTFDGAYIGLGVGFPWFDFGCFLNARVGAQVAGWYVTDSFGGKVRGWLTGEGACLVSVRGDLTLIGGKVNDSFKLSGKFWVAGGIGFCDEEDWDTPSDVLDDDFCTACVGRMGVTGRYPPDDLDLDFDGPEIDCSL